MKICGVDEVGCASIAGPVFTCAVIIDSDLKQIPGVKDSKLLTKKKMNELFPKIIETVDAYSFGAATVKEIEGLNIHYAKFLAMKRAVQKIRRRNKIDRLIIDGGFKIPNLNDIKQEAIPKADKKFWEVSCASILAKVTRDKLMANLAKRYPYYGWETNAGYYSPKHREGVILHGPTVYHRKNFEYFKYCLFCHEELKKVKEDGMKDEEYLLKITSKGRFEHYREWKRGDLNLEDGNLWNLE